MILQNFMILCKFHLFSRKTWFCMEFWFFWLKISFSPLGPPKKLPEAYVYHYFCAGRPKVPFLGEMGDSGAQNLKMERFSWFWAKMGLPLGISPCHLKKVKYFLRNTWCFDMSKNMKFMKISWLSWNFPFFAEIAKKLFYFLYKIHVFGPVRLTAANVV